MDAQRSYLMAMHPGADLGDDDGDESAPSGMVVCPDCGSSFAKEDSYPFGEPAGSAADAQMGEADDDKEEGGSFMDVLSKRYSR